MKNTIAKQRQALLLIAEWHLPYNSFSFDNGSNGERDYFKKVAQEAL